MEQMDDNIIREKINSLHELPDGYSVSLESKWELLQAGIEGRPKRKFFLWYAAAMLILLLIPAWIFINHGEKENKLSDVKITQSKISLPHSDKNTIVKYEHKKVQIAKVKAVPPAHEYIIKKTQKNTMAETSLPQVITKDIVLQTPQKDISGTSLPMGNAFHVWRKQHKRRYVEMDFGDGNANPAENTATAQNKKFKLNFSFGMASSDANQEPSRLQLKKTF